MTTVLYPGSFDPFHNGHLELVETAAYLFDEVVVAAMRNPQKGEPLFTLEEREEMIDESLAHLDNVRVVHFSKLVVDLAQEVGADFIVKGLRAASDFESEMAQAQMNLAVSGVAHLFIPSASANSFIAVEVRPRDRPLRRRRRARWCPKPCAKRLKEKFRHVSDLDDDLEARRRRRRRRRRPTASRRRRAAAPAGRSTSSTTPGRCRCRRR